MVKISTENSDYFRFFLSIFFLEFGLKYEAELRPLSSSSSELRPLSPDWKIDEFSLSKYKV